MANKNHELDVPIIKAAFEEFMKNGYQKASLRKIAAGAGVTIGAIYTRYPTKEDLFAALVEPLLIQIQEMFIQLREGYYQQADRQNSEDFFTAMSQESNAILHLLFDDYDRAVLLLCRSTGSRLEHFFDDIVEQKIQETIVFFEKTGIQHPDFTVLRLLIASQFHMYFQVIEGGFPLETAKKMIDTVMIYHMGGWCALFGEAVPKPIKGEQK